jgi:hypothetical protein
MFKIGKSWAQKKEKLSDIRKFEIKCKLLRKEKPIKGLQLPKKKSPRSATLR